MAASFKPQPSSCKLFKASGFNVQASSLQLQASSFKLHSASFKLQAFQASSPSAFNRLQASSFNNINTGINIDTSTSTILSLQLFLPCSSTVLKLRGSSFERTFTFKLQA